jgi:hypothetical protein
MRFLAFSLLVPAFKGFRVFSGAPRFTLVGTEAGEGSLGRRRERVQSPLSSQIHGTVGGSSRKPARGMAAVGLEPRPARRPRPSWECRVRRDSPASSAAASCAWAPTATHPNPTGACESTYGRNRHIPRRLHCSSWRSGRIRRAVSVRRYTIPTPGDRRAQRPCGLLGARSRSGFHPTPEAPGLRPPNKPSAALNELVTEQPTHHADALLSLSH